MATARIGVLGGIGPEATARFYSRLIGKMQEEGLARENSDFPQLLVNSIPAAELVRDRVTEEELKPYIAGLQELDRMNVDFIVMVCNTVHLFYERLQGAVQTRIIDLRQEVAERIGEEGVRKMAVVGTPLVMSRGMYSVEGVDEVKVTPREANIISAAIFNYNSGFDKGEQTRKVREIAQRCVDEGAERIVTGCTEVALMLEGSDLTVIDTGQVLIDAVLKRIAKEPRTEETAV